MVPDAPPMDPSDLPPVNCGPALLREAIRAKGQTEAHAAEQVFSVTRPTMSGWLNRTFKPKGRHRDIAHEDYGVHPAAWDSEDERADRLARLARKAEPVEPAPASAKRAPRTRRRRLGATGT